MRTTKKNPGAFSCFECSRPCSSCWIEHLPAVNLVVCGSFSLRTIRIANLLCKKYRLIQTSVVRQCLPPSNNRPVASRENKFACLSSNKMPSRPPLHPLDFSSLTVRRKRGSNVHSQVSFAAPRCYRTACLIPLAERKSISFIVAYFIYEKRPRSKKNSQLTGES